MVNPNRKEAIIDFRVRFHYRRLGNSFRVQKFLRRVLFSEFQPANITVATHPAKTEKNIISPGTCCLSRLCKQWQCSILTGPRLLQVVAIGNCLPISTHRGLSDRGPPEVGPGCMRLKLENASSRGHRAPRMPPHTHRRLPSRRQALGKTAFKPEIGFLLKQDKKHGYAQFHQPSTQRASEMHCQISASLLVFRRSSRASATSYAILTNSSPVVRTCAPCRFKP
jgi:hypothetical protein